jgi:peptidoglycan/LPS O-acetylase OafA/YrhL
MVTAATRFPIGRNAFDLIRLLAALQVAVVHSTESLAPGLAGSWWIRLLALFPGVPIFFFISGLLISRSYETNSDLREYAVNRSLRIFPALVVCVALNLVMVASTGYFATVSAGVGDVVLLGLAKSTFLQFYNPDFMRGFGDGVLNGSLWTICVELQFYCLVPLLYVALRGFDRHRSNLRLLALTAVFFAFHQLLGLLAPEHGETIAWKLFHVSFLPWFYMFLVGVLVQRNLDRLLPIAQRVPMLPLLGGYVAWAWVARAAGLSLGNGLSFLVFLPLAFLVFRAAFSGLREASERLRRNDVSYGVYIWHMPFVNQLLFYEHEGTGMLAAALVATVAAATLSWFLVERPMLTLKRRPMHAVRDS